jgi:SAM-dependent methyltransferase
MPEQAAAWTALVEGTVRETQLNGANIAADRVGREVVAVVAGAGAREAAVVVGRETGLLLVPEVDQVLPAPGGALELVQQAQEEGWRVMLVSVGIDSETETGATAERMLGAAPKQGEPAPPPLPHVDSPIPPAELRQRVSVGTEASFDSSGTMHVELYEACLREAGGSLTECEELLEWGAGCGRMTRYLRAKAPQARITAADTDAEAIAWTGENLDVAAAVALPLGPPTEFAADSFDRVVGHSIFTHLEVDRQDQWLAELARITRPDGYLAVSFHGPIAFRWHRDHPLVDLAPRVSEELERDGISIWRGDGWEQHFYEGYHTTFHTHDYVREHWSQWFEVVAIREGLAAPTQDIAILRPR